jgi:hypothetical protein
VAFPLYSVRFLAFATKNLWYYYTVPAGHRIIVRSITLTGNPTVATGFWATLAGVNLFIVTLPASERSRTYEMRQVGYAGEALGGSLYEDASSMIVSGYLLRESALGQSAAPELETEPAATPEWALE